MQNPSKMGNFEKQWYVWDVKKPIGCFPKTEFFQKAKSDNDRFQSVSQPRWECSKGVQKTLQFEPSVINFHFWYHDGMPKDI